MENFVRFPIYKEGQTGMNTTSESRNPCLDVVNVPADRSELSSSKVDELLEQATTALRQAIEVAWKVHVQEVFPKSPPAALTTPDPARVSPSTARLTLYCGVLGTLLQELASIAPISPAEDASNSSKPQESSPSSPRMGDPFSPSSTMMIVGYYDEPSMGSVVLDSDGDVWQRDHGGWNCANGGGGSYNGWSWQKLSRDYTLRLLYRK